ncbi:hypothetical protein ACH3VS_27970 [Streptomyces sp. WSLK1-3]|uniref:hypothetical protein n=1 Tax=Streptomyces sp. WSLK1-3 TaxID=3375475 RepID=UPI0037A2D590
MRADGDQRQWPGQDALAGMTVWAVLVPEALAYATIAPSRRLIGSVTTAWFARKCRQGAVFQESKVLRTLFQSKI